MILGKRESRRKNNFAKIYSWGFGEYPFNCRYAMCYNGVLLMLKSYIFNVNYAKLLSRGLAFLLNL